MRTAIYLTLLAALVGIGCSSSRRADFSDVQKSVLDRTGQRIIWNRQTPDDRAAAASIQSLLNENLTPDRAVQIALLNNHSLQATYEDIGIAQADLVQAGLLKNPVFSTAVEFGDGGKGTKLQFSVVEDFISILQIPLKKRLAESSLAQVKLRVASAAINLAAETRSAFYTAQASAQTLELRQTVLQASEASFELAKRIRAAGNSNDLDLATQQAQLEQAKLDLSLAQLQTERDREHLTTLMGLASYNWKMVAHLPDLPATEIDAQDIERRAVECSLDLELARAEVASAAQSLHLTKSTGPFDGATAGASSEKEVDGTWETGPAVSVPIPVFDTGQASSAAARARYAQARERYRAAEIEIRASSRLAAKELLVARARAEQYRQTIIPLRHHIVEATQTQYNAMLAGAFVVLDARREEINAGVEYVAAQRDYWLARTRAQALVAGKLSGGEK